MLKVTGNTQKRKHTNIEKLNPFTLVGKHARSNKDFTQKSGKRFPHTNMRLCLSLSPQSKIADRYLKGLDNLCYKTRKNIEFAKGHIVSLRLSINKSRALVEQPLIENDEILAQCREFVYERKFTLKTQQEHLFTKKMQKSVTRKMIGTE